MIMLFNSVVTDKIQGRFLHKYYARHKLWGCSSMGANYKPSVYSTLFY